MTTKKDKKTREIDTVREYRTSGYERKQKPMPKTTKAVEDALLREKVKESEEKARKKKQTKKAKK